LEELGAITPMAILEPIVVAGSKISKTTLHNEDFIKEKDLRIGDTVVIQKAGDVIPEIVKSLKEKRTGKEKIFQMPKVCPVCGAPTIREEGVSAVRCIGIECPARNLRNIIHFSSKEGMDIDGLGEKIVEQLLEKKLINNIADIYYLKEEDIKSLKKDGTKFASNLIASIENSKYNDLDKLICALGIRHIGGKSAKTLAKKFKSIENLQNAKIEELALTQDVGEIMAESIYEFFKQDQTTDLINRLKNANVNLNIKQEYNIDNRFEGKTFVLTGGLENYTRDEASRIIENFGGKVSSSVSKNTSYVLEGEAAGSKLEKANKLGINIITEEQFIKMIS
jgi:DNA ligase (NAD+)